MQVQTDKQIKRNREARFAVAVLGPILVFGLTYNIVAGLASFFGLFDIIGALVGAGLGAYLAGFIALRSFVVNESFVAFVTVDPVAALLKWDDPYVSYGPGFHFAFPWEQRIPDNVVNLVEVTEEITTELQGKEGSFMIDGSVRLTPDITKLREHLSGASVMVKDVTDLIVTNIAAQLAPMSVKGGITFLPDLNKQLKKDFEQGPDQKSDVSDFEGRFGVHIGDVTIATIRPSKEVQKALDGAAESEALNLIVARNLGYQNMAEVHQARSEGKVTQVDIVKATKLAMAMTDNLHGLQLSEQDFNLSVNLTGIDPDVAKALAEAAPAVAAALAAKSGAGKPKGGRQ